MASITFDGPNKIIDIGYDAGTTIVTAPAIYSEWKRWVQLGNAQYVEAFDLSVGGNDLGGGAALDGYYFLRNDLGWRVRAADIDHELVIEGQLFGFAAGTAIFVSRPGRTITYRQLVSSRSQVVDAAESEVSTAAAYQGKIVVDPNSAFSDTNFLTGTATRPVNNWAAAVTLAMTYGLRKFELLDALPLSGVDVSGYRIEAQKTSIVLVVDASATVQDTTFENCVVTGTFDGHATFSYCGIAAMSGVSGNFVNCVFAPGGLVANGDIVILGGSSGIAGNGSPEMFLGYGPHQIQMRGYSGSMRVRELGAGATMSADLLSGRLIVDADCTGGELKVRGVGEPPVINSALVNVDQDGFVSNSSIVNPLVANVWAAAFSG